MISHEKNSWAIVKSNIISIPFEWSLSVSRNKYSIKLSFEQNSASVNAGSCSEKSSFPLS